MVDTKKPKVPKPDKALGKLATEQTQIAREMANIGRTEHAFVEQRFRDTAPIYDRVRDTAFETGEEAFGRADELWSQFERNFAPIEEQFTDEVRTFGTEADQRRSAEMARAGVASAFEGQRGQMERDLARSGVNPNSPAAIAARAAGGNTQAAAEAGAANVARLNTRLQGINLRGQAVGMGRQLQQMSSAERDAGMRSTALASDVTTQQTQARAAGAGSAATYMAGAASGLGSAASTIAARDQQRMAAYQAQASEQGALYGALGTLGGFGIMAAASSKTFKENMRKSLATKGVLEKIKRLDVQEWDYKADSPGDGGTHIGPYAEDVHREFGDVVAPRGKFIDLISMHGVELAAIQELAKRMDKLEGARDGR